MNYDVIIIGAGLGGLTAGAKLARQGKKVLLLEQHSIPGGCATTFKRKGYTMEVGLHEMDGLDKDDVKCGIFQDLDIFSNVSLQKLPEFYRYVSSQIDFVMPDGVEETFEKLLKKFPHEEKGLRKYFKLINGTRKEVFKLPVNKYVRFFLYPLYPLLFPNVVRSSRTSVGQYLDDVFDDETLKLILTANICYYHNDPYTTSMIYFSIGQDGYYNGGWYVKGGSQKLSNYLASCIENNGGKILYNHKVNEVLVDNNKAVGVVYENIKETKSQVEKAYADHIIANNAVPLLQKMLPQKQSDRLGDKISNLEKSLSLLTLYIGFKKTPKSLGNKYYSTFIANDDVKNLKDYAEDMQNASFDKRHLIFVDYDQIDSGLAPDGKSVGVLVTTDNVSYWEGLSREEYNNKKEEVSQVLISRLENLIPGIKEQIDYYELGTAKTVERYTLNPGGAVYGYAQTVTQTGDLRFGKKLPIKNLHIASAWGFPGGGFTGAIIAGYLTSQKLK